MIPLSDRAIFNMEKRRDFPSRIALTSRNVAWDLAEVEEWIKSKSNLHHTLPAQAPLLMSYSLLINHVSPVL